MNTAFSQTRIPTSQLLVDIQNPRLPEMGSSQDDAIRLMVKAQGNKIFALAQHLANNGTNPASLPIVIPAPESKGKFYVLDGNRRLTALRLLERPELADNVIDGSILQKIKQLSLAYKRRPITEFECVVFSNREEADPWIQLIHRGESQGAGLVEWNGQVAARYDERKGIGARGVPAALQILDLVKDHGTLSQKTREKIENGKFPITNLTRLINTPYVRKKINIDIKNDTIGSLEDKAIKNLVQIVEDIGTEYITVSDIKRVDQRIDYIDKLLEPHVDTTQQKAGSSAISSSVKKRTGKEKKPRNTIIPKDFLANITQNRINTIFRELKKLDVDNFPNAGSIMLRVFLELSIDHFLEETVKWPEQQVENSSLAQKLIAVANDLESKQVMSPKQLAPIRKAAGGQTLLAASVKTLHGYVHNKYFSPIPSELKTAWDDVGLFVSSIWPA